GRRSRHRPTSASRRRFEILHLRDVPLTQSRAAAPLAALAVTVGLHLWRRNALLSILGGTVVSVALASSLFAG
ncbi:AzlD domain-containing protein, partial [Streptomyces sp. NPDC056159]|uniref:AzlD domain-containing protein n=1 Tax=Streptomyces sp. NPDC056159 TaxID=3155537 RepID=UPI0034446BC4